MPARASARPASAFGGPIWHWTADSPQNAVDTILEAFRAKRVAGNNPWGEGATTLEWMLSSPPPFHQWETLPRIR